MFDSSICLVLSKNNSSINNDKKSECFLLGEAPLLQSQIFFPQYLNLSLFWAVLRLK